MDRRMDTQITPFPGLAAVQLVGDMIWGAMAGGGTQLGWDKADLSTIPL